MSAFIHSHGTVSWQPWKPWQQRHGNQADTRDAKFRENGRGTKYRSYKSGGGCGVLFWLNEPVAVGVVSVGVVPVTMVIPHIPQHIRHGVPGGREGGGFRVTTLTLEGGNGCSCTV